MQSILKLDAFTSWLCFIQKRVIYRLLLDIQSDANQTLLLKSEKTAKEVMANTTVVANGIAETNYFTTDAGKYKFV